VTYSTLSPFDLIWTQLPPKQNHHSSSWWFFLLFPRQKEGFGPKQIMFAVVSRAGETIRINGAEHPGLSLSRPQHATTDCFQTSVLGWIYDGATMHKGLVHDAAAATLSSNGHLHAWDGTGGQMMRGASLNLLSDKPFGIRAEFMGDKGFGRFDVWGDPAHPYNQPNEYDVQIRSWGANVIYWPHFRFSGEFCSPGGHEWLEGIGYFQRICLNFPPFPWKWIWATFADETVFSAFIPYVGLNGLRRGDWFFPNLIERATYRVLQSSYLLPGGTGTPIFFDDTRITPLRGRTPHPQFAVSCRSANGDFFQYRIDPYAHTQFLLDHPLWGSRWHSRYNYNEYLHHMQDVRGRVAGRPLNLTQLGPGFGNLEYTWGFGL
jgi:hypothetical protein